MSHKDFQMPCVKFLISPTILKYIITQTQTSFKKCLSLKHVWPPFLDFRDLGFFLLLSFLFKPDGRGQCRSSRGPILITLMLCHGLTPKKLISFPNQDMLTATPWAAPRVRGTLSERNLPLPNSNISLAESQAKEWQKCCHNIAQSSHEHANI